MAATFKAIRPKAIKKDVFEKAFKQAASDLAQEILFDFEEATDFFKKAPVFKIIQKLTARSISVTVTTNDKIFGFYDLGTKPHIIKPVVANVLHWVDRASGEDRFAKEVHHPGYEGRKVSLAITKRWDKRIAKYFDWYLKDAIRESGHAL